MDRLVHFEVKAVETAKGAKGEFEALVAVFDNVDSYGDRIIPGAFQASLDEHGFPRLVWSHQWKIPPIGETIEAKEIDEGLFLHGGLFVDQGIELVDHIYAGMSAKNGDGKPPLREFSFGYDVKKYSYEESNDPNAWGGEVRNLEVITCFEAGPCLVGVNPDTELLTVKGIPAPSDVRGKTGPQREAESKGIRDRDAIDRFLTVRLGR